MQYRTLGRTGLRVSTICLGTVFFGSFVAADESSRIIRRALDQGVNFLDTAEIYQRPTYGISEETVGDALQGHRHEVVLATKKRIDPVAYRTGRPTDRTLSRAHIIDGVEGSLRRLRTDHLDVYYAHHPDPGTPFEEALRAFDELVQTGKVRYVGLSNYAAWQVVDALAIADSRCLAPIACLQNLYNLLDRSIEGEIIPSCERFGLGLVPYSPLAGGVLTGKYNRTDAVPADSRAARFGQRDHGRPGHVPVLSARNLAIAGGLASLAERRGETAAQLALAWTLHQPAVTAVIMGASNTDQLNANVAATELRLTPEEIAQISSLGDVGP